jgi:hypothetical protein
MARYGDGVKPKRSSTGWYAGDSDTKDPVRPSRAVDNSGNPTEKARQQNMDVLDRQQLAGKLPRKS